MFNDSSISQTDERGSPTVSNVAHRVTVVPKSNVWTPPASAVPERFRTISEPIDRPVMPEDLSSTTGPSLDPEACEE